MITRPYLLHALSPLHAGTGQAASVIDLPIARLRSTGIPFVPGSSIKGVLRHARRPPDGADEATRLTWEAVFGPESQEERANEHAGALVVSDARLVALPVRSFRGTFAFVTSPLLLELSRRDLGPAAPARIEALDGPQAQVVRLAGEGAAVTVHGAGKGARIFLEDLDLAVQQRDGDALAAWAALLGAWLGADGAALRLAQRLVLVDDETMNFLWDTATQVDTRVRLDPKTRTVARGALWVEESLPPESLLLGLLAAERSRHPRRRELDPEGVLAQALPGAEVLQFGGKASGGRGRCRVLPQGQGA